MRTRTYDLAMHVLVSLFCATIPCLVIWCGVLSLLLLDKETWASSFGSASTRNPCRTEKEPKALLDPMIRGGQNATTTIRDNPDSGRAQLPPNCCQYSSPDATSYSAIQPILLYGCTAWTAVWTFLAMVSESVLGHHRDLELSQQAVSQFDSTSRAAPSVMVSCHAQLLPLTSSRDPTLWRCAHMLLGY
ncbi:hypothetical protein V8C44DRAFT_150403 [Trichoderma aethiopicum]